MVKRYVYVSLGLALFLLLLVGGAWFSARLADSNLGTDVRATTVVDLGSVRPGMLFKQSVHLVNPTKRPLAIKSIEPSCGCTTVTPINTIPARGSVDVPFTIAAPGSVGRFKHTIKFVLEDRSMTTVIIGETKELFPALATIPIYPAGFDRGRHVMKFSTLSGETAASISSDQPWLEVSLVPAGAELFVKDRTVGSATVTISYQDGTTEQCHVNTVAASLLESRPDAISIVRKKTARERTLTIGNITGTYTAAVTKAELHGIELEADDKITVAGNVISITFAGTSQTEPVVSGMLDVTADVGPYKDQKLSIPVMSVINR